MRLQFLIKCVECFSGDCQCGGIFEASVVFLVGRDVEESAEDFQDEGAISRSNTLACVKDECGVVESETGDGSNEGGIAEQGTKERVCGEGNQFEVGEESAGCWDCLVSEVCVGLGGRLILVFDGDFSCGWPVASDPQPFCVTGHCA